MLNGEYLLNKPTRLNNQDMLKMLEITNTYYKQQDKVKRFFVDILFKNLFCDKRIELSPVILKCLAHYIKLSENMIDQKISEKTSYYTNTLMSGFFRRDNVHCPKGISGHCLKYLDASVQYRIVLNFY